MVTMYAPSRRMHRMMHMVNRMAEESALENPAIYQRTLRLPVDVHMTEDGYHLTAIVPGIQAEELHIEILDDTLTLSAEFPAKELEDVQTLLSELPSGEFRRTLTFPTALATDQIEAKLENGLLKVYIPKAETARPKTIQVKAK